MITGNVINRSVRIGNELLSPTRSQGLVNHSPDGFAWGYGGSGPSQLALAILLEYLPDRVALTFYQQFKSDIIANLPHDADFELKEADVKHWIAKHIHRQSTEKTA